MNKQKLTDKQFNALKEYYVDTIVEGMSVKDLIYYVTEDMQKWIDNLTFNDAMEEIEGYFDEYFTETIEEVLEQCDS